VNFADLVDAASVVQEAFGDRGLAGVDVGHDADVAHARQPRQLAGFGDGAWRFVGHGSADYRKSIVDSRQASVMVMRPASFGSIVAPHDPHRVSKPSCNACAARPARPKRTRAASAATTAGAACAACSARAAPTATAAPTAPDVRPPQAARIACVVPAATIVHTARTRRVAPARPTWSSALRAATAPTAPACVGLARKSSTSSTTPTAAPNTSRSSRRCRMNRTLPPHTTAPSASCATRCPISNSDHGEWAHARNKPTFSPRVTTSLNVR